MLTDTHTHLYLDEFDADRTELINKAVHSGITRFFLPNIDSKSIPALLSLEKTYPDNCFPMMGLHPCSVSNTYQEELKIAEHWLRKRKFAAVGEIGIDLYWDKTFFEQQEDAFQTQIKWAKELKLPVVIHTRNSFDEAFDIVLSHNDSGLRGIFHCFSGTVEQARKIISLGGFKMGIGGVVTFKNSGLDNVVREIGLEHFVLETDSPYLAPAPHRGKRNEPQYLMLIAQKIAELKNIPLEQVAEVTTQNSKEVFGF